MIHLCCLIFQEEFEDSDEEGSEPSSKRRRTGDGVTRTACSITEGN